MSADEPSEERVNAAARAMQREDPIPMQMFTFDEICDLARAALIADAAALVDARIEGMRETRDELSASAVNGESKLIRAVLTLQARAIEARIAALQADLDKERGKTI